MELERAVQVYAIINLTVIGVSHVLRPRAWVDFFDVLRQRGEAGVLAVALLNLAFGSIIVAFHNVWSGIPLALTLVGWVNVAKALAYLTFPAFALRKPVEVRAARSASFLSPRPPPTRQPRLKARPIGRPCTAPRASARILGVIAAATAHSSAARSPRTDAGPPRTISKGSQGAPTEPAAGVGTTRRSFPGASRRTFFRREANQS